MHAFYSAKAHKFLMEPKYQFMGDNTPVMTTGKVQLFTINGEEVVATMVSHYPDSEYHWEDKVYLGEFEIASQRTVEAGTVPVQE